MHQILISILLTCFSYVYFINTCNANQINFTPRQISNSRLLQFGDSHFEWVHEDIVDVLSTRGYQKHLFRDMNLREKFESLTQETRDIILEGNDFGPGFIDVTEHRNDLLEMSEVASSLQNSPDFPKELKYQEVLNDDLFQSINNTRLYKYIEDLSVGFRTRHHKSSLNVKAAEYVASQFNQILEESARIWNNADDIKERVTIETYLGKSTKQPSVVVKILPETDVNSSEIVILGAHEDSIASHWNREARAPGADDDASGIALILEIFRALMAENGDLIRGIKREIHFMAFAAEEAGLLGSKDLARNYRSDGKKVAGMVQFEMSGYRPPNSKSRAITIMKDADPDLQQYLNLLSKVYILPRYKDVFIKMEQKCGYGCSDHASWLSEGYKATCLAEAGPRDSELNPNIHSSGDSIEKLDMEFLRIFGELGLAFAVEFSH